MTDSSAALRTAVANLHPRERRAMRHECDNAARRWADMLPTVANVWRAMIFLTGGPLTPTQSPLLSPREVLRQFSGVTGDFPAPV